MLKLIFLFMGRKIILKRMLSFVAVIVYMLAIFSFSSQQGEESNQLSAAIVKEIKGHAVFIEKSPYGS